MALGRKTGGRKAGVPNKATQTRETIVAEKAREKGQLLGKEVMAEVMMEFYNAAQKAKKGSTRRLDLMKMAGDMASKLTPYQSPQLQRTTLRSDAAAPVRHKVTVKFV